MQERPIGAAIAHFGALHKLRRNIEALQRRLNSANRRIGLRVGSDDQTPARFQPRARLP
jgi:hypothetical protein